MRIGMLKFGGIGDMCDAVSLLRAIKKAWGDPWLTLFTDCRPMIPFLERYAHVIEVSSKNWQTVFREEAWKFERFYDFRPHCCRVFSGDPYGRKVRLESDSSPALMKRWKHYNSWETNKLQDLKQSVITLNLDSAELPKVPYEAGFDLGHYEITGDYITLNIGAMGSETRQIQTKQWDIGKWQDVVDRLKSRYDFPIYHVGIRWEKKLKRCKYVWSQSLMKVASILEGARLHLGVENGMIRLRRLVTTKPSVVLFGPTAPAMYGFENNINIHVDICRPCFWYTSDWMYKCALDWNTVCMKKITIDMVMKAAEEVLDAGNNGSSE